MITQPQPWQADEVRAWQLRCGECRVEIGVPCLSLAEALSQATVLHRYFSFERRQERLLCHCCAAKVRDQERKARFTGGVAWT